MSTYITLLVSFVSDNTGMTTNSTGVFFKEQTLEALNEALVVFEANKASFVPDKIRLNALRFSRDRYKNEIKEYVRVKWNKFKGKKIYED